MTRRRQLIGLVCVGLGLAATAFLLAHRSVSRRVEAAVAASAAPLGELDVERLSPAQTALDGGGLLWTDVSRATDGTLLDGRLIVTTAGGLVEVGGPSPLVRTAYSKAGPFDHDLTAVARRDGGGEVIAVGSSSGTVTLIEGAEARSVRIDDGRSGAIVDLVWFDEGLYAATSSGALLRLSSDLRSARRLDPVVEGGLTALAVGAEGLHVAGADGSVYRLDQGGLSRVATSRGGGNARLTALAFRGGQMIVGTPVALLSAGPGGHLETVRDDLFVTALLVHDDLVYVGTYDQGVFVLDGARLSGTPLRQLLPGQQIHRIRLVDGRPLALGPGLVAHLDAALGEVREHELPRGIASNYVTALAFDDRGRLWVGHFDDGVDVLEGEGAVVRHLPTRGLERLSSVNALVFDWSSMSMLVATSHGVLEVDDGGVDVVDRDDGLIGESVTALLAGEEGRVFATSRGLTVAPRAGGEMRSLYAFHGLPSNRLYALARGAGARGAELFVGTLGGVALLEDLRVMQLVDASSGGLRANWCSALASAPEGVYVGSTAGGVDLWRVDGRLERFELPGGSPFTVNPGAMLVVGDHLLVGTVTLGLLVLDRGTRRWVEISQPLPGASVTALAHDDEKVYLGTDRGLIRVARDRFGV